MFDKRNNLSSMVENEMVSSAVSYLMDSILKDTDMKICLIPIFMKLIWV